MCDFCLFFSNRNNLSGNFIKKIAGPHLQRALIPDEPGYLFSGLLDIKVFHCFMQKSKQHFLSQRGVHGIIAGLTHSLLKMLYSDLRVPAAIPDKIIPIAPFNPAFPPAAEDRVQLTGKKIGQAVNAHRKGKNRGSNPKY